MSDGILSSIRKSVKKKKGKAKSKQLRRRRNRQKRREAARKRKEAVVDFGTDLEELAAATRPGEAVRGAVRGTKTAARGVKRGGEIGIGGLDRVDRVIDNLGLEAPEGDFIMGDDRESRDSSDDIDEIRFI